MERKMNNSSPKTSIADMMSSAAVSNTPSNSKSVIKSAIMDMVKSLELQESEKDHQKDVAKSLKDNHNIPAKVSKGLARRIFKGNDAEKQAVEAQIDKLQNDIM